MQWGEHNSMGMRGRIEVFMGVLVFIKWEGYKVIGIMLHLQWSRLGWGKIGGFFNSGNSIKK